MDLSAPVVDAVRAATVVAPVGGRTQWGVGGPPPAGAVEVRAPSGVLTYEPADMTVTVGAGTTWAELNAALEPHGQEVPLDPRRQEATIGGVLACGLSGVRRLRHGPLRDHVLEVRFVTGDAVAVKGGGPTVKNVTGYDLPRLFVGSLGTLGVLVQATLRCRPHPACARWFRTTDAAAVYRPSSWLWDGTGEYVLLEGVARDVDDSSTGCTPTDPPAFPDGPHRGRISIAPGRVRDVGVALGDRVRWLAEMGVGTIHVAADDAAGLVHARALAEAHGGWMLREAGGDPADDGIGRPPVNIEVLTRLKQTFDPDGKLNPGRVPWS